MPYQPGVVDRSGEILAQGITGFSNSIADAIARHQERKKNEAREFKALQEYADATGIMKKEESTPLGLDALRGRVKAAVYRQDQEMSALKKREVESAIRANDLKANAISGEETRRAQLLRNLKLLDTEDQGSWLQGALKAALSTGNPEAASGIASALRAYADQQKVEALSQQSAPELETQDIEGTDSVAVKLGKSMQLAKKSKKPVEPAPVKLQPVFDPEGNPVGHLGAWVDEEGKLHIQRTDKAGDGLEKLLDEIDKPSTKTKVDAKNPLNLRLGF